MRKRILRIALALVMMLGILAGTAATMPKKVDAACSHPILIPHIFRDPSCSQTGLYYYTCWYCERIVATQEVPLLPHKWKRVTTVSQATCTRSGVAFCRCDACGTTAHLNTPATGHSMVTTFENGILDRYCIVCGYREPAILV